VNRIHPSTHAAAATGSDDQRLMRAVATLAHTHRTTGNDWLHRLTISKSAEAVARLKLATCGYRVRYDRTDPRSVW